MSGAVRSGRLTVLLVGDHEIVRQGLRGMLEAEKDIEIVGACNAAEATSEARRLRPDIVLVGPGMNGVAVTHRLTELGNANVMLVANGTARMVDALKAGAAGFLERSVNGAYLAETIRQVYRIEHSLEPAEEAVHLIILPGASQTLLQFIAQLEKLGASIVGAVPTRAGGTTITILLEPDLLSRLLKQIRDLPEVEKAEEEPSTLPRPIKVRVTLRAVGACTN